MIATMPQPAQYLLLHDISWDGYEALSREMEGQRLRVTYDRGAMEIMTTSYEHENYSELLSHFLRILTMELTISMCSGGSTTFRKKSLAKGLEPDKCWWIQNEPKMRRKKTFDIERDPPPDLAIEVEITVSALNRLGVYAALKVPEVWRFDGEALRVLILSSGGKYRERPQSRAFPFLPMDKMSYFLKQSDSVDETTLLCSFADWVRDELAPTFHNGAGKNGKRPGK